MIEIKFEKENNKAVAYNNNIKVGECVYIETLKYCNIVHTQVSSSYQGQGIAKKLVEKIIEYAKIYKKELIADCTYAKKILDKIKN